jgi:hypothetical protein
LKTSYTYLASVILLAATSCGDSSEGSNKGPIILGDSATIVTETDSQYLKDEVMDIEPRRVYQADTSVSVTRPKEPVAQPARDTAVAAKPQQVEAGQSIDFGGAKVVLAGLKLREPRKQNTVQEDGLSYTLNSGDLGTSRLLVYGAKNITIRQRYQSKLVLKSSLGTVDLRDLGLYTSGWNNITGSATGNAQSFGLNSLSRIAYAQVNNNKIKNAADRELRKRRTNSRTIQNWMKEIRRVRSGNDKPCEIILDNVQWQISGTDEKGKPFRKTIRVDA